MTPSPAPARRDSARYVGVVLVALVCLVAGLEVVLRASVIPEDIDAYLVERVYRSPFTDAMFGDSHFRNAFRIEAPGFISMSTDGSNTRMMQIRVREYFRHRAPQRVILQASAQLFSTPRIRDNVHGMEDFFGQNRFRLPFQLYFFEPGVARLLASRQHYFDAADLQRLGDPAHRPPDDPLAANNSWGSRSESFRTRVVRARVDFHRPVPQFERTPDFDAYVETLALLASLGARVCLLRTPVTREYLNVIDTDERYRAAESAFVRLAAASRVRYVDFRALPMVFADSVFSDQDHLNRAGSRRFVPLAIAECFPEERR